MTLRFGVEQPRGGKEFSGRLLHAVKKPVLRLLVGDILVCEVERDVARKIEPDARRDVAGLVRKRHVVVILLVLEHRIGIARAYAQSHHRQRFELDACANRIRALEGVFEFGLVLCGEGFEPFRRILHADAVVPVAFVVDGHEAEIPEGVREAEHQARR